MLKKYLREITHAVEISSIQNAAEAVEDLQDTVNKAKEIRGSEIFELVYAAADIFAASIRIPERTATVEEFRKQCDKCGKIEEIFSCLGDFQKNISRSRLNAMKLILSARFARQRNISRTISVIR